MTSTSTPPLNHLLTVATLAVVTFSPALSQNTWHVDASASAPGNGSQTNPFTSIQAGITAASDGDTVLVLPGTYVEILGIAKCVNVVSTHGATVTTIDGNQSGSVVTFYNIPSPGGRLEGFTITNGQGPDGPDGPVLSSTYGCPSTAGSGGAAGGINCGFASPLIRGCVITGNTGGLGGHGGGCFFGPNLNFTASGPGGPGGPGGVLLVDSAARLESCFIVANTAGDGGMGGSVSTPSMGSNGYGGDGGAGGVQSQSGGPSPTVVGCVIANNHAGDGGDGGQDPYGASSMGGRGGIGGCDVGVGQIGSSTVVANAGGAGGFGISTTGPNGGGGILGSTVVNSIVWGNAPDDLSGTATATHSNLGNLMAGIGNISIDPQFTDATNGDFHILATSPCVDAGDNLAANLPTLDIDGDPRIYHGTVDMGADETVLTLLWEQAGGPGTPLSLSNYNLTSGNEYHNLFSLDICPGGPGTGPHLGLCLTTNPNYQFILEQLQAPLGTPLFHFAATQSHAAWGPYQIPPMTVDGVVFDFTAGVIGPASPVTRITIQ